MSLIDWSSAEPSKKEPEPLRLRLRESEVRVRLLGQPISFFKVFVHKPQNSWVVDDPQPIVDALNIMPSQRYAVNVIDRADGNVKIMEGGPQLFKAILAAHRRQVEGVKPFVRPWWQRVFAKIGLKKWVMAKWPEPVPYNDPGGEHGMEIVVKCKGQGMLMRYEVSGEAHILNDADKAAAANAYSLLDVFKAKRSADVIREIHDADNASS